MRSVEDTARRARDLYALANNVREANQYGSVVLEAARECGVLLGKAKHGGDRVSQQVPRAELAPIPKTRRHEYRAIAKYSPERLVEYREAYGEFVELEDLVDVRGIGESTVAANAERIRFE